MTHLNFRTTFSSRQSLAKIEDVVKIIKEHGHNALAINDIGSIYGAVHFYKECKKNDIKPLIGSSVYVTRSTEEKNRDNTLITLIAKNQEGYTNLCNVLTHAHLHGFYYVPRTNYEILKRYSNGLICISGPDGPLYQAISERQSEELEKHYHQILQSIYGKNFYISIWPAENISDTDKYFISKRLKQLIFTTNIRYTNKKLWRYYGMLDAIRRRKLYVPDHLLTNQNMHLMTDEEIQSYFQELGSKTVDQCIQRTDEIASSCNFEYNTKHKMPDIGIKNSTEHIKTLVNQGYRKLLSSIPKNEKKQYKKRAQYELDMVIKSGFVDYFLIIHNMVQWAKLNNIMVGPGRGSASSSLLGLLLETHTINPIKYGLYFERFLNPARTDSPPDIDLDFESSRREEVIQYLINKYGQDKTANIGNVGTLFLKSAMKDVGKALNVSFNETNEFTKLVPFDAKTIDDCIKDDLFKIEYNNNKTLRTIMRFSDPIIGTMRQAGTHAAGVIIVPDDLMNHSPLQRIKSPSGEHITTQLDMKSVDYIGLIKFDLLGLTTLSTIHQCYDLIKEHKNKKYNITIRPEDIPQDQEIYNSLSRGNTAGVFQLENYGITKMAQKIKVQNFEELVDLVALYRPAILHAKQDKLYIRNKHNPEKYKSLHPMLDDILRPTKGVCLFQETYLRVSIEVAGFSPIESETLRYAVGKKQQDILMSLRDKFIDGCHTNGMSKADARDLFKAFEAAGSYSFNRAHSVGYATISYLTAFLKETYPHEYMTAVFNSEINNIDKYEMYLQECNRLNVILERPDINTSLSKFSLAGTKSGDLSIRYGLAAVKNVGFKAADKIVEARNDKPYKDILDFMKRTSQLGISSTAMESLAKTGCFYNLNITRENTIVNLKPLMKFYKSLGNNKLLFEPTPNLVSSDKIGLGDFYEAERELLGFSF